MICRCAVGGATTLLCGRRRPLLSDDVDGINRAMCQRRTRIGQFRRSRIGEVGGEPQIVGTS
jgi:hypothetical protein